MDKKGLNKSGCRHRLTGVLALGLLVLTNFQSALIGTALWLVEAHGHDHQIVVRADGNHLDVRLSHRPNRAASDHEQEPTLGAVATLFSTHDHDGNDHVLHFNLGEAPDQLRLRNTISPAPTQSNVVPAADLIFTPTPSAFSAAAARTVRSSPITAGLLCLRTTVLLI